MTGATDPTDCHCGHPSEDHAYTPSGCGSTHCMVDNEYGGYSPTCPCREYDPVYDSSTYIFYTPVRSLTCP
jgi:hypothetical protein